MPAGSDGIVQALRVLSRETRRGRYREAPVYLGPVGGQPTPFRTLVSCLISTRTRDEQTNRVSERLFRVAPDAEALSRISEARLARLLYGVGFYRQKARQLRALARELLRLEGVPETREVLMKLPGIGPKCANIVLAASFGKPAVAVDTHVHRIANRMGWVRTRTPEETEAALTPRVPVRLRRRVNALLVGHGQLVCKPRAPRCDVCAVFSLCEKRGVSSKVSGRQVPRRH